MWLYAEFIKISNIPNFPIDNTSPATSKSQYPAQSPDYFHPSHQIKHDEKLFFHSCYAEKIRKQKTRNPNITNYPTPSSAAAETTNTVTYNQIRQKYHHDAEATESDLTSRVFQRQILMTRALATLLLLSCFLASPFLLRWAIHTPSILLSLYSQPWCTVGLWSVGLEAMATW